MSTSVMEVLKPLGSFFYYALLAVFAQNAIFTRALGVSRMVKLVDDDTVDSLVYCALLTAVQLIAAPLAWFAYQWIAPLPYRVYVRPLVFVGCSVVAFFVVLLFVALVLRDRGAKEIINVLPMSVFNCTVLGTLLLSTKQSFSLLQTLGFALGSSVGYLVAILLVTEGQRKLQNRSVPSSLKGLPVTLLYIGILSLALYGFTGHSPAI